MPDQSIRINFVTGAVIRYVPLIEALAGVPERVEATFAGQSGGWARQSPAEGEWSAARIAGHLIAYARQQRSNLLTMAYMTDPSIKLTDDEGENERNAWESQPPDRLIEQLTVAVGECVELLKELPDSAWGRPGQHPDDGRRSIRQHVSRMADHFNEHIAQLEAMRR